MVDTYSKSAENRKLHKKSYGDGEDPIIIAQRFLNIFRQLHIFSAERKEAFNKMILEQPPEIRGMFGSLPGGSLLQEYVDELEQNAGILRDHSGEFQTTGAGTTPELSDEISRAKILATALAEAQIQANAKLQANIPPVQPTAGTAPQPSAPIYSGTSKIVADASFAKEISAAFSQALKFSEERTQTGNKQLAAAVIASQEKMAKMFIEKSSNNELTSALIATQEKMAQALAENAAAIKNMPVRSLGSGKETSFSSSDSSREILDAIRESQDKMAQMFMQHNTMAASNSSNTNANNIQINTAPMPPMEDIVKGIVKAQSELFREMSETQTKELSAIISVALKESQQLSSQTIIEAMERMQKENQKFFELQAKNAPKTVFQPVYLQQEAPQTARPIHVNPETKENFQIPEVNPTVDNDELTELFSDEIPLSDEENQPKKKKKKKKKKNKNKEEESDASSLLDDSVQAAIKIKDGIKDGLSTLTSTLFKKDVKDGDIPPKETDTSLPSVAEDVFSETPLSEPEENAPIFEEEKEVKIPSEDNAVPVTEEAGDGEWSWEEVPEEETPANEVTTEDNAVPVTEEAEDGEWSWEEVPEEETPANEVTTEDNAVPVTEEAEDGEWSWEEVPEDETPANEVTTEDNSAPVTEEAEDGEWSWEEVPEDETEETVPEQSAATKANAEEDGDWEWEYEEVPEDETEGIVPEQSTASEANAEEDGDWEWEYEEVPEDEKTEEPTIAAAENIAEDPYAPDNNTEADNPLNGGDLVFRDDLYKEAANASPMPVNDFNLGIADISDEKENKEPYIPKDDIVG